MIAGLFLSASMVAQATPKPCWHPAQIVKKAEPIWPESLSKDTPPFDVLVLVTVGTDGAAANARIYKSSGYPDADAAAISAAKATTYEPGVDFDCAPSALDYLFHADFRPSSSSGP